MTLRSPSLAQLAALGSGLLFFSHAVSGAEVSLDPTFTNQGLAMPTFPGVASLDIVGEGRSSVVQADGKILVAGTSGDGSGDQDVVVVRFNASGTLDTSFGTQGTAVSKRAASYDVGTSIALQSDGKIVVVGHTTAGIDRDFYIARFTSSGAIDNSFGTQGVVITDFAGGDDEAYAVVVDANDRIIVGGTATPFTARKAALACYLTDGELDPTFGDQGLLTAPVGGGNEEGRALTLQPDGKIIFAGYARLSNSDQFSVFRFDTDGLLDTSFGSESTGIVVAKAISTSSESRAYAVAMTPDQKIVVAGSVLVSGSNRNFALMRFESDGYLDPAFSADGIVTTAIAGTAEDIARAVTVQSDGKIVAAGRAVGDLARFALARFNTAGALDSTFGVAGQQIVEVPNVDVDTTALAVDGDGRLIAVATRYESSGGVDFGMLRCSAAGVVDGTFGTSGQVTQDLALVAPFAQARAVAVQGDGKILVSGFVNRGATSLDFVLLRYLSTGTLDTSFGTQGYVTTAVGSETDFVSSMLVQPDGKIVLAGYTTNAGKRLPALVRYLNTGALDSSFGTGGIVTTVTTSDSAEIYDIALQSDGKIVAAGSSLGATYNDVVVFRYTTAGALDTTFGSGTGRTVTSVSTFDDVATSIAIDSSNRAVLGGISYGNADATSASFALLRYTTAGVADSTFDSDGRLTTAFTGKLAIAQSLLIQADNKIVLAGSTQSTSNGSASFALARYSGTNGALDTTFDTDGRAEFAFSGGDYAFDIAQDGEGRLLLAGSIFNGSADFALARVTTTGALDTTFDTDGYLRFSTHDFDDQAFSIALQADGKFLLAGGSGSNLVLARLSEAGATNQPPVAVDDTRSVLPGGSVLITVLANDSDPELQTLSISAFTQPASGGSVTQEGQALRFTAAANFTSASFTYTVSDGAGGLDTATVTLTPVSTYAEWATARFGALASDPEVAGSQSDPDQDGVKNILEYALGRLPLSAETQPLVTVGRTPGGLLQITYQRWVSASDMALLAEFGTTLTTWSSAGTSTESLANDGILQTLRVTAPATLEEHQFGRVITVP